MGAKYQHWYSLYQLYSTNYSGSQRVQGRAQSDRPDIRCRSSIANPRGTPYASCENSQRQRSFLARLGHHWFALSRTNYYRQTLKTFFHWIAHYLGLNYFGFGNRKAKPWVADLARMVTCRGGRKPSIWCGTSPTHCSSIRWLRACAKSPWLCHLRESSACSNSNQVKSW